MLAVLVSCSQSVLAVLAEVSCAGVSAGGWRFLRWCWQCWQVRVVGKMLTEMAWGVLKVCWRCWQRFRVLVKVLEDGNF
jgi:hypothetical protein